MGARHFTGETLVGYTVCNESYLDKSEELPPLEEIIKLKDRLIEDIDKTFGVKVNPKDIKAHLLFDSINGY